MAIIFEGYLYCECPECEFDAIIKCSDKNPEVTCPMCEGDSGHLTKMVTRTSLSTDEKPEGSDERMHDDVIRRLLQNAKLGWQEQVGEWMVACFGTTVPFDKVERFNRFLEEALELVQALGMPREYAHTLVDYTYNRKVGQATQEVGGVMVTLAALCNANAIDIDSCKDAELLRCWRNIEKIRAKQAAKPKIGPLPE